MRPLIERKAGVEASVDARRSGSHRPRPDTTGGKDEAFGFAECLVSLGERRRPQEAGGVRGGQRPAVKRAEAGEEKSLPGREGKRPSGVFPLQGKSRKRRSPETDWGTSARRK
ncbi:MAG: hypothetical protein MdMp014T_2509 [Treponematales bacterium]